MSTELHQSIRSKGSTLYFACCASMSRAPIPNLNFPECVHRPIWTPSDANFSRLTCMLICHFVWCRNKQRPISFHYHQSVHLLLSS